MLNQILIPKILSFVVLCVQLTILFNKVLIFSDKLFFVDRNFTVELEIKDTTDATRPASYLVFYLEIDSEVRLKTKLYDKRDGFNFPIVNFPSLCNSILAAPVYGVYIS